MEAVPFFPVYFSLEFCRNIIYIEITMTDTNTDRKMGWFRKAVLVLLTLFMIISIVFYFGIWRVPDRTKEAEALIREHEEMVAKMSWIPEEENAWTYYEKAADGLDLSMYEEKFEHFGTLVGNIEILLKKYNHEDLMKKTKNAIKLNNNNLKLIDQGYRQESAFIKISHEDRISWHYKFVRLSGLLVLTGIYEYRNGSPDEGAKRYLEVISMGVNYFKFTGESYTFMNNMDLSILMLRELVNNERNNRSMQVYVLSRLTKINREWINIKPNIVRVIKLIGEYWGTGKSVNYNLSDIPGLYSRARGERQRRVLLNTAMTILEYFEKPFPQAISLMNKAERSILPFGALNDEDIQMYKSIYIQTIWLRTNFDAVSLLAALHLYRLDYGQYPDTLALLSPKYLDKIPGDQFSPDGKYIYKKRKDGSIILYSVGSDMKDEGGRVIAGKAEDPGDIVFYDSAKK